MQQKIRQVLLVASVLIDSLLSNNCVPFLFSVQSAEVLEFVKRDLDELSSTVKNEASQVVNSTTSVLKEQLSVSMVPIGYDDCVLWEILIGYFSV